MFKQSLENWKKSVDGILHSFSMNDLIKISPYTSTISKLHFQLSFHDTLETLRVGKNTLVIYGRVKSYCRSEILIFLAEILIGFLIAADHFYGVLLFQKLGHFNGFIPNKKKQSIFSFLNTHTLLEILYSFTSSLHPKRQFTTKPWRFTITIDVLNLRYAVLSSSNAVLTMNSRK